MWIALTSRHRTSAKGSVHTWNRAHEERLRLQPPRIAPRHLFDLSVGTDNLLRTEHTRMTLRFTALNLTDKKALYNFLSTFSGTHFVSPRAIQAQVGVTF